MPSPPSYTRATPAPTRRHSCGPAVLGYTNLCPACTAPGDGRRRAAAAGRSGRVRYHMADPAFFVPSPRLPGRRRLQQRRGPHLGHVAGRAQQPFAACRIACPPDRLKVRVTSPGETRRRHARPAPPPTRTGHPGKATPRTIPTPDRALPRPSPGEPPAPCPLPRGL